MTEQESTFQVDPPVPGLPPSRGMRSTAGRAYHIPAMAVNAALALQSPTGASYRERIDKVKTEKELSEIFEDFIGIVPLGERLFGDLNPVRTGGPMQVSIAYAERTRTRRGYPYPMAGTIRHEVFTRRGGMYFGIAHLLDYPAAYDEMLYRFADFNAGHYASRNAAFQNAVSVLTEIPLALDGDLLLHGDCRERAERDRAGDSQARGPARPQRRRDPPRPRAGEQTSSSDTRFTSVSSRLATRPRQPLPRAVVPRIRCKARRSRASSPPSGSRTASTSATGGASLEVAINS